MAFFEDLGKKLTKVGEVAAEEIVVDAEDIEETVE